MYTQKIMEMFQNPKNVGAIRGASGIGKVGNPVCGDIMNVYLKIEDGVIVDAKFKTFGCVAAIVSSSVACELIKGKTIEEAKQITNKQVLDMVGPLPANKIHCSILAEEAIGEAIKDYYKRLDREKKRLEKAKASK